MPRVVLHIRSVGSDIEDSSDATVVTDHTTTIGKLKGKVIFALHLAPEGDIALSSDPQLRDSFLDDSKTVDSAGLSNGDSIYYKYKQMTRTPSFRSPSKTILKKSDSHLKDDVQDEEKEFRWDEDNIELYDIEKKLHPRTKIDEPDTPFHTNLVDKLSGDVKDNFQLTKETYSQISGGQNLPQPNITILQEIREETKEVAEKGMLLPPASPESSESLEIIEGDLIVADEPFGLGIDLNVRDRSSSVEGQKKMMMEPEAIAGALESKKAIEERSRMHSSDSEDEVKKDQVKNFKTRRKAHYNEAQMLKEWKKHADEEKEEEEEEEVAACTFGAMPSRKRTLDEINKMWSTE